MSKQQSKADLPTGSETKLSQPNSSGSEQGKSNKKRKKHHRLKKGQEKETESEDKSFPDDGVMRQLKLLDESDIVRAETKPNIFAISNSQGLVRSSSTNGKVYLEVKGGFRAVDQNRLTGSRFPMAMPKPEETKSQGSTQEAAVGLQGWFRRVATVCHGLLAGLALCQALTVWLLAPPHHTWKDFVEHYTYIAYPFYASSHFLLIICVISVFDRYDVCKFQWCAIRKQLGCGLELLTLLLYPLALAVALMGADRDIRLGQFHKTNSTIWWDEPEFIEKQLDEWKLLVLVKCIATMVGWLLLGMNPLWDQFYHRLKGSKEE